MKCVLIFTILIIAVVAMAVAEENKCSPWLERCAQHEECCLYTTCSFYARKCVPIYDIIPGEDERPLGPGPYPPNVPKELLP